MIFITFLLIPSFSVRKLLFYDDYFQVKRPPLHGYLEIDPPSASAMTSNAVSVFEQSIINEGRLHYIQSISNQSSDSFVFEVSNGISSLNDLVFHLTILPKVSQRMSCKESEGTEDTGTEGTGTGTEGTGTGTEGKVTWY